MNEVAEASSLAKGTLYHYFTDKSDLLFNIADGHVSRLVEVVQQIDQKPLEPPARLRELITVFMQEYAVSQHVHRVLTEDVKFLNPQAREIVIGKEWQVVQSFAQAIAAVRPELDRADLSKPLTMLLFGMLNWMFTWVRSTGRLSYPELTPIVINLFFYGLLNVQQHNDTLPPTTSDHDLEVRSPDTPPED